MPAAPSANSHLLGVGPWKVARPRRHLTQHGPGSAPLAPGEALLWSSCRCLELLLRPLPAAPPPRRRLLLLQRQHFRLPWRLPLAALGATTDKPCLHAQRADGAGLWAVAAANRADLRASVAQHSAAQRGQASQQAGSGAHVACRCGARSWPLNFHASAPSAIAAWAPKLPPATRGGRGGGGACWSV
jgi:hypothetical protein